MNDRGQVMQAYGEFVASLAGWRSMWTLTHDAKRLTRPYHDRVGVKMHRRKLREWFHETVRRDDRTAQWWSELELHETGQPHEHGLLAHDPSAPTLRWRSAWWELSGYAYMRDVDDATSAAAYAAKYVGKATAVVPAVWGFALRPAESYALVVPELVGRLYVTSRTS